MGLNSRHHYILKQHRFRPQIHDAAHGIFHTVDEAGTHLRLWLDTTVEPQGS